MKETVVKLKGESFEGKYNFPVNLSFRCYLLPVTGFLIIVTKLPIVVINRSVLSLNHPSPL